MVDNVLPLGPPTSAFLTIRPTNAAAQLAFSDLVEHIQDACQDGNRDDSQADNIRKAARHMFLASHEQSSSFPVGQLQRRRIKSTMLGSSSPISEEDRADSSSGAIYIWTGGFAIDLDAAGLTRWRMGRYSTRLQPDVVLTMEKVTGLARDQVSLCIDPQTRLAFLTASKPERMSVESLVPEHTPEATEHYRLALTLPSNSVSLGQLDFTFEYTDFARSPRGQNVLTNYLKSKTDTPPTQEAISATPTPGGPAHKIGAYTVAGIFGAGTFGAVRPAFSSRGDQIVAIKTVVSKNKSSSAHVTMQHLTQSSKASTDPCHILTMLDYFHSPGVLDETHLVLSPFTPITMDKLPVDTHRYKHEIVLRDCLRGLKFLHDNALLHGDVKPNNIGITDFHLDDAAAEPTEDLKRHPKAFLLDVDSVQHLPIGETTVSTPGQTGTLGYLAPERELSRYDHTVDIWSLGVATFRVLFGRQPFPDKQGNPWRVDAVDMNARQHKFQSQHENALDTIASSRKTSGRSDVLQCLVLTDLPPPRLIGAIKKFIWNALYFENANYDAGNLGQTGRMSSQKSLISLIKDSSFLQELEATKNGDKDEKGVGCKRTADQMP